MLQDNIEKCIKLFPPVLYFLSSVVVLLILANLSIYKNFHFSHAIHSILYVVFMLLNLPIGIGIILYSYWYLKESRGHSKLDVSYLIIFKFPIEYLVYGLFMLWGYLHILLFAVLIYLIISNDFSIPQLSELPSFKTL